MFPRDSGMTPQAQHMSDAVKTYESNMAPEDALPSHARLDLAHDNTERILEANGGPDQTDTIAMLATIFIENVKVRMQPLHASSILNTLQYTTRTCYLQIADLAKSRFGEESYQTAAIFKTLGKFKHRALSKREAISTISETLGCHDDLKQNLMNVLHHRQSRWAVDDFDLPLLSTELSTPQFLQPVHEPHMRLPSLFTPWDANAIRFTAPSPAAMTGCDGRLSFERLNNPGALSTLPEPVAWNIGSRAIFSSSVPSDHPVELASDLLTLPAIEHTSHAQANLDYNHPEMTTSHLDERDDSQQPQSEQPWERQDHDNGWESAGFAHVVQHGEALVGDPMFSLSAAHEDMHPESPHHRRSELVTAISAQHSPNALLRESRERLIMANGPYGEGIADMPPPLRKRNYKSLTLKENAEERGVNVSVKHELGVTYYQSPRTSSSTSSQRNSSSRERSRGRGAYVHGICGKSFSERSKVKKHHWGNKNGDSNTTTGCWHKHKRPNVSWDDHSSCKSVPRTAPRNSRRARSAIEEPKAPVVPGMVPNYRNVVPDLRTSQDLPRTYKKSVQSPHTALSFARDGPMHNNTPQESNVSYHSHCLPKISLPPSSPFESLLTAVNVAATIDEPTPKGRNDSVVICELDAQAIAAERTGQYTPAWAFPPGYQDEDYHSRHSVPSPRDNSFGMGLPSTAHHMPFDIGFSQSESIDYAAPDGSPTFSIPVYADRYASIQSNEGNTAEQGFGLTRCTTRSQPRGLIH
jgi:hypothetical protein